MEEYISLISVNNIPMLRKFTDVVIGLAVVIGFLVVFLSMYTAVLERTREIGILKALGASPGYILGILAARNRVAIDRRVSCRIPDDLRHARRHESLRPHHDHRDRLLPGGPTRASSRWSASLIGAIYPGLKAARQDAIEALSYD